MFVTKGGNELSSDHSRSKIGDSTPLARPTKPRFGSAVSSHTHTLTYRQEKTTRSMTTHEYIERNETIEQCCQIEEFCLTAGVFVTKREKK